MESIQNLIATAEKCLNPIDWVPGASSFSGMVRYLAGVVGLAVSAAFAYIKIVQLLLSVPRTSWIRPMIAPIILKAITYSQHAAANMIRGMYAMIPIANMLLWVYDNKIGRFNYPLEKITFNLYPIGTAKMLAH